MKVLGLYGSPRRGGNTDLLLEEALKGAASVGAEVSTIRCCELDINGCIECGSCDHTGECSIDDAMQGIYPRLLEADVIFLAAPMFFYGIPGQAKLLIDRSQAMWCRRMLEKTPDQRRQYHGGKGYLLSVGATKGATLFDGAQTTARYFFDALDKSYNNGVFVKKVEGKGDILNYPDSMQEAYQLGVNSVGV